MTMPMMDEQGGAPQGPPEQPPEGQPAPDGAMPGPPVPVGPQPDPRAMQILQMLPVDELPEVAQVRVEEFARAMASKKFTTFPPEWQLALVTAFTDARRAAGIATVAEQQMVAEQQHQEELAMRQQQMQMEADARAREAGAKGEEADKQRTHERDLATEKNEAETERTQIQAAARQGTQPSMQPPTLQ